MDEAIRNIRGVPAAADQHWPLMPHVIDSLSSELAVLDRAGSIILTNQAWKRRARENAAGAPRNFDVGSNYLEICSWASGVGAEIAKDIQVGFAEVLSGIRERFCFEYPWHSLTDLRWFLVQASKLDI